MVAVALLSNPQSTGNRAILPRVRSWCATQPDIFHYEVEQAEQISMAMASIALVRPRIIAININELMFEIIMTSTENVC